MAACAVLVCTACVPEVYREQPKSPVIALVSDGSGDLWIAVATCGYTVEKVRVAPSDDFRDVFDGASFAPLEPFNGDVLLVPVRDPAPGFSVDLNGVVVADLEDAPLAGAYFAPELGMIATAVFESIPEPGRALYYRAGGALVHGPFADFRDWADECPPLSSTT